MLFSHEKLLLRYADRGCFLGKKKKGEKKRAVSAWCQFILIHSIAHLSQHNDLQQRKG